MATSYSDVKFRSSVIFSCYDLRTLFFLLFMLVFYSLPGSVIAGDVTGSWEYHGAAESAIWLKTHQQGENVRFQLEIQRGAPSYNSGWIEGSFLLKDGSGTFKSDELKQCEISFVFTHNSVQLKQSGDSVSCGFGYNVFAEGALELKSPLSPHFSQGDPRFGGE